VLKGLAAFGSIDILHKKRYGKLTFHNAFMCKVFPSLYDGNLLALWITITICRLWFRFICQQV